METLQEVRLALAERGSRVVPVWPVSQAPGSVCSRSVRAPHKSTGGLLLWQGNESLGTVWTSGSKFHTDTISKIHISETFSDVHNVREWLIKEDFAVSGNYIIFGNEVVKK